MKKQKQSELMKQLLASVSIEQTKRKCREELDKAFDNLGPVGLHDKIKCLSIVYVEEEVK